MDEIKSSEQFRAAHPEVEIASITVCKSYDYDADGDGPELLPVMSAPDAVIVELDLHAVLPHLRRVSQSVKFAIGGGRAQLYAGGEVSLPAAITRRKRKSDESDAWAEWFAAQDKVRDAAARIYAASQHIDLS